jgi:hypothetical protein
VLAPKSGFTGSKVSGRYLTDRSVPLEKSAPSEIGPIPVAIASRPNPDRRWGSGERVTAEVGYKPWLGLLAVRPKAKPAWDGLVGVLVCGLVWIADQVEPDA